MAHEYGVDSAIRGQRQFRGRWRRLATLAARQHGVVARSQLFEIDLSRDQADRLLGAGMLQRIHRGVYAVGHGLLSKEGRWMAAVLAGGLEAVLSHQTAAMLWALLYPTPSVPHITTAVTGRRRPGIRFHTAQLPPDEVTTHEGIPTTTVARTLLDLATTLDAHRLERAIAEAEYRGYADSPSLPELLDRYPRRRGARNLRAVLDSGNPSRGITRSSLEDRFLRFLDARGLPRPELNVPLELDGRWIEVDCLWRTERVIVELDDPSHLRARNLESDRLRDRRLSARGWEPVRVTERQLDEDGDGLEDDLRSLGVG
jgi:predicted transcriptional regulator of viral defense system